MDQPIGHVLQDRYQVRSLLGRKTGRRTFLATDLQTQDSVVVKLLLFNPDFVWDDLKLFEREAETLKCLEHPAIPQYLDFFEVETEIGKGFALVQSYLEARSLQEWVQSGRSFSEADLKAIAQELLAILDYLHNRQPPIIHRDIKPSNVLLGDRSGNSPGQVYLVDFGSVQTAASSGTITVVGTYGYMPPEQFGGRALPASDLYGVGVTLIYLATGQHPSDLPQKDLYIEFEKSANLSRSFARWIRWLTEPSLSRRATSAQEAIRHFQQAPPQGAAPNSIRIPRPSSLIQVETTPSALDLVVPTSQMELPLPTSGQSLAIGCLGVLGVLVAFYLLFSTGIWVIVLLVWLVSSLLSKTLFSNRTAAKKVNAYNVSFEMEDGSIYVNLYLANNVAVFPGKKILHSISAGPYTTPSYRLNIDCGDRQSFHIKGSRAEIQWLCDELD
ncbi:serine/threonine protein kinase, partial [filamentous cyanobacterium CCP1]